MSQEFNKIIFGPPGTGKSKKIQDDIVKAGVPKNNIFRVTFHEDYSYHDFVGQLKPYMIENYDHMISMVEGATTIQKKPMPIVVYDFIPGIFTLSYIRAKKTTQDVYLIIEEINRGKATSIFGDIFQLLDRDNNGDSCYEISTSIELKKYIESHHIPGDLIKLPRNLKIWATMNTSDQSLYQMDAAFKRRFDMDFLGINLNEASLKNITIEGTTVLWMYFLEIINKKIMNVLGNEDKQMGQFFVKPMMRLTGDVITEKDFKNKVLSYLYYDVFKHDKEIFNNEKYSTILSKNIKDILNDLTK